MAVLNRRTQVNKPLNLLPLSLRLQNNANMSSTPSFVLVAIVVLALLNVALSMPAPFFNDDGDMGMGSELASVLRVRRNAASSMIGKCLMPSNKP